MLEVQSSLGALPEDGGKISKEVHQKRDLLVLLKAKPPKKGNLIFFPETACQSLSEEQRRHSMLKDSASKSMRFPIIFTG